MSACLSVCLCHIPVSTIGDIPQLYSVGLQETPDKPFSESRTFFACLHKLIQSQKPWENKRKKAQYSNKTHVKICRQCGGSWEV